MAASQTVQTIQIFIKYTAGQVALDVDPSAPISSINGDIMKSFGVDSTNQRYVFNGKTVEVHKSFNDYQITKGSNIFLVNRIAGGSPTIQIIVKYTAGQVALDVDPSAPISSINGDIMKSFGVDATNQRYVFNGKTVEVHKSFNDYQITKGASIFLVNRIAGGSDL